MSRRKPFDELYREFEDAHRGSLDLIRGRQSVYLPLIEQIAKNTPAGRRALDIGCGRGEWLGLIAEHGWNAIGVDSNASMTAIAEANGIEVISADALDYLRTCEADSFGLITAFHVVEHIEHGMLTDLLNEVERVLMPGGVVILETPNPENLTVASWSFHMDPTHQAPLPPALLQFFVRATGLEQPAIVRLNSQTQMQDGVPVASAIVGLFTNAPDYSIIASKPGAGTDIADAIAQFASVTTEPTPTNLGALISEIGSFAAAATTAEQAMRAVEQLSKEIRTLRKTKAQLAAEIEALSGRLSPTDLGALMSDISSFATAAANAEEAMRTAEHLTREVRELQRAKTRFAADVRSLAGRLSTVDDVASGLGELQRLHAHVQWQLDVQAAHASQQDLSLGELKALPMLKLLVRLRRIRRSFVAKLKRNVGRDARLRQKLKQLERRSRHSLRAALTENVGRDSRLRQKLKRLERRIRLKYLKRGPDAPAGMPAVGEHQAPAALSRTERLAFERLSHAMDLARAPERDDAPRSTKPRLAFVSPLPPERSGVADYSAQILPELRRYYDIDVVVAQDRVEDDWIIANCGVRSVAYFESHAHSYDRILYHFGNSEFHIHMFSLLRRIPGVVVLHDFYLGDIICYIEYDRQVIHHWTRALLRSHGYVAVKERFTHKTTTDLFPKYPSNIDVLTQSQGVIFHSEYAVKLTEDFYPTLDRELSKVIPLVRQPAPPRTKEEARRILGFSPDDIIVCSFGFIMPVKLSVRLADAWLESPLCRDRRCHLIFVGDMPKGSYADEMRARMKRSDGGQRIRTTGFVSAEIYSLYLQAADIGVQLRAHSRGETSAAALDCLAYGLATIVNANGSMAELPADCVRRLDDTFETSELARALSELCADQAERERLSTSAAAYVATSHNPSIVAARYHEAIEEFANSASALQSMPALMASARDLVAAGAADDAIQRHAGKIGREAPLQRGNRHLFIDVSVLAMQDFRTGIQRVVRALLLELLNSPPAGYRIEPVRLSDASGQWKYYHAASYMGQFFTDIAGVFEDEAIEVGEGDLFIGADFYAGGVVCAARSGIYRDWRARGVRVSFIVYDILPLTLPECFPPHAEPAHKEWISVLAAEADDLVCISASVAEETRAWLETHLDSSSKLPAIHPWTLGADIAASLPSKGLPADAEILLGTFRGKDCFLMVGTIEPRKGHLQALDAFDLLWEAGSEARLVIVGNEGWRGVPRDHAQNLPDILERLRNHPEAGRRLFWLQGVSDEFLDRIYQEADCLIAASLDEGFGLPLIEAARHGVPILARDIPVFREVAGNAAAYFSGRDGASLAAAIDLWLREFREGRHPKPDSMKWLSWAESADRLKNILLPKQDAS
ncbi:glycosyltransferase [Ancylobacter sp. VNQ12]|uniref:glycosyltransferase n=1 Tax=Ancylobacter sp. VNQ12 TaxID=3400920 RepID=UPI003BFF9608